MAGNSLSARLRFVEGFSDHEFWVGADVHKRSYHVAIYRVDGMVHTFVCPADPATLLRQLFNLKITIAGLVYEAGPTGFALARIVAESGIPVMVAAPSRIPRPVLHGAKTDRLDCIRLAEYAAKDMVKPIAIPTEAQEASRMLSRQRHRLVDSLRKCKQRIKGKLLFLGITEPPEIKNWTKNADNILLSMPMEETAKLSMKSLVREMAFLRQELRTVETDLKKCLEEDDQKQVVECLKTVPGVGQVVANTFCLELFRPERFSRPEEVTSYLGLAPMVRHSGLKTPAGRLRPVGQKQLRSLLIEAAWMWKARDSQAKQIYNRILNKSGIPQKAITALARKLAVLLWRLCIERREYVPLAV